MFEFSDRLRVEPLRLRRAVNHIHVTGGDDKLFAVRGEGNGSVLEVAGTVIAAWMPLRGQLNVHAAALDAPVYPGWVSVTGPDDGLRAAACTGSSWLALIGSEAAWVRLMASAPSPDARVLPAMHAVDPDLRRRVIELAQFTTPAELRSALRVVAGEMATLQAPLYQAIARCPGRSFATRLQVFLRLQHVRRFMAANCEQDLDNLALARIANYSPCHFLRTFKKVYRETPHTCLIRQRLRQAQRLLRSGGLAVTEVALASGFDSRNTFSRCYRQYFGMTARDAMRRNAPDALRSAAG